MIPAYESSSCVGSIISIDQPCSGKLFAPIITISVIESEEDSSISENTKSSVLRHSSAYNIKGTHKNQDMRKESDLDRCSCIVY